MLTLQVGLFSSCQIFLTQSNFYIHSYWMDFIAQYTTNV